MTLFPHQQYLTGNINVNKQLPNTSKAMIVLIIATSLSTVLISSKINTNEKIFYTNINDGDKSDTICPTKGRKCQKINGNDLSNLFGLLS